MVSESASSGHGSDTVKALNLPYSVQEAFEFFLGIAAEIGRPQISKNRFNVTAIPDHSGSISHFFLTPLRIYFFTCLEKLELCPFLLL
jgi:hypothetical protein